jgi:hypothetical protein
MSGKGGGSTPTGDGVDCVAFYKNIPLLSPNPEVVHDLKNGDQLEFDIFEVENRKVLRVTRNEEVAGAVTKNAAQLIRCIQNGHNYIAIVTEINDGSVMVEARMKS